MKQSKSTEEQIIAILQEQEAGAKTAAVCRRNRISSAMFFPWKNRFGGMEPSEARRLKMHEDEHAKLKPLLAEAIFDNCALRNLLSQNGDARRVVGWSAKAERDASLAMDALMMAVWQRSEADALLHHSDQGCAVARQPCATFHRAE